ncbi:MAG: murein biosynthesis integral membrane protein MurJ [Proteobacteria bacterium]|nr:murein biosynthesis integral membrane protein MurJ [Pseudomonadota bacterium]
MSRAFLKSTSVVGLTTLLSRITGMARDVAQANLFGGGPVADAFLVAYKIPNFLRRLFAEGAFSQSFVPVVSEYKHRKDHREVEVLINGTAGTLGLVLFVITLIGVIGAPVIIWAFAPGFSHDGGRDELAVEMLRLTFPYLFFISLTALGSGVLNSYGSFGPPAFTQVLSNLVMIVAAVWIAPMFPNPGVVLAAAVFISGLVQVLYQIPFLLRLRLLGWPRWRWDHEGVRKVSRLMVPGILGSSMAQISLLLDTQIASFLATGSVSWMYFADRLMEFPLGVFSIALATVILPGLSGHHAAQSTEKFSATLDWALKLVTIVVLPAALALFVLAGPLTATFFGHGRFSHHDVIMSSYALMAYAFGLMGFSFVKVLAPGYFARQDTRTPVRVGLMSLGVNIGLNLTVVAPLAYFDVVKAPHAMLALSTGIGACVNSILLYRGLRRREVLKPSAGWNALLARALLASLVMAGVLWWLAGDLRGWFAMHTGERVVRTGLLVTAGALVYFAALYASGMRPRHVRH